MKRICLISGGHVASNPRLVKEADTLHAAGFEVLALGASSLAEISKLDEALMRNRAWTLHNTTRAGGGILPRAWKRLTMSRAAAAVRRGDTSPSTLLHAVAPWGGPHLETIRQFSPDLIIAHTLPALAIAAAAARNVPCPYAFDMEDYHPGERNGGLDDPENHLAFCVLRTLLPGAVYVTAASPGIAEKTMRSLGVALVEPILNVFPHQPPIHIPPRERRPGGISLYWFSQTIGWDRGLQDALAACARLKGDFQLHLRGHASEPIRHVLGKTPQLDGRLFLHPQVSPDELFQRTAEHDVGLALEPNDTLNRDLCISNKILLYPAAGLAVAASRTQGQAWVMQQAPEMGFLYAPGNAAALARGVQAWMDDPPHLQSAKEAARRAAKEKFCWERESSRFLRRVEDALS